MIYIVARVITFQPYMHWMSLNVTATVQAYQWDKAIRQTKAFPNGSCENVHVYIDLVTTCTMLQLLSVIKEFSSYIHTCIGRRFYPMFFVYGFLLVQCSSFYTCKQFRLVMNSIRHICSLRRHICSLKRHIFEIGTHSILNSPVDNKGESRELKSRRILDILNIILNVCDINLQLVYKTTYFIFK